MLALLAGPSPSALPPWDEAPIQIRHMLAFADKAYMHKKVQSWLGAQLEARLHACPHASHEAKATVRSLLQVCVCVCVHRTALSFQHGLTLTAALAGVCLVRWTPQRVCCLTSCWRQAPGSTHISPTRD